MKLIVVKMWEKDKGTYDNNALTTLRKLWKANTQDEIITSIVKASYF